MFLSDSSTNGADIPPPPYSPDSAFWNFWNNEFTHPIMEYPTEHLLGKTSLDYSLAVAEAKFEQGESLSETEVDLLRLAAEHLPVDIE
jgi:hypothetical protein